MRFLIECEEQGTTVTAYDDAPKGSVCLNSARVGSDLLPRVPVHILIPPWSLQSEVVRQLASAPEWGTRFGTAVPQLSIRKRRTRFVRVGAHTRI
jgi:hypothetical protein